MDMDNRTRLKNCWRLLSKEEKQRLADDVLSSAPHLSQLANGHKPGSPRFWVMLLAALPNYEKKVKSDSSDTAAA